MNDFGVKQVVYDLTGVSVSGMSAQQILDDVVLPFIFYPSGQDTRGWRISDKAMKFAGDFGHVFYNENEDVGYIILELAMQRLSRGAVLHEATQMYDVLPEKYRKYSAAYDQYGLLSDGCWYFIMKQAPFCLSHERTKDHMKKILLGLHDHLTPDGRSINGFMLGSKPALTVEGKAIRQGVDKFLNSCLTLEELCEYYSRAASVLENNKAFFRENWGKIDQKAVAKRIGIKGIFKVNTLKKMIFATD